MSFVKREPLREIKNMFDRCAKALGWPSIQSQELISVGDWSPSVDISETDNEFQIKVEIPEVKKEDVKVSVDMGVLTIQEEKKQEKEEK